jgi:hypothetical protein
MDKLIEKTEQFEELFQELLTNGNVSPELSTKGKEILKPIPLDPAKYRTRPKKRD